MAADLAEQKKAVLPYLQRAEEVASVDPKVAYYCRMWAVDQGLKLPNRHKDIDGLLSAALTQLERDKAAINADAAAGAGQPLDPSPQGSDRLHVEAFALGVFRRADRADRAGRADANTAKAYYAASLFLDVLNQWGDLEPELFERQRYAAWRAAEVRKALREGRAPAPPPSGAVGQGGGGGGAGGSSGGGVAAADAGTSAAAAALGSMGGGADSTIDSMDLPAPPSGSGGAVGGSSGGGADLGGLPPPHHHPHPHHATAAAIASSTPGPAALAGPRFRPGSRVLYLERADPTSEAAAAAASPATPEAAAAALRPPEEGTVGALSESRPCQPGGPAVAWYKVALRDRIVEAPDGALAPNAAAGQAMAFFPPPSAAAGAQPVTVLVLAMDAGGGAGAWPPAYLVRRSDASGGEFRTTGAHLSLAHQVAAEGGFGGGGGAGAAAAGAGAAAPSPPPPSAPSAPSAPPPPPPPPPPQQQPPRSPTRATGLAAVLGGRRAAAGLGGPSPGGGAPHQHAPPSLVAQQEALKAAKCAVSSLSFDDVSGAIDYLQTALRLLQGGGG